MERAVDDFEAPVGHNYMKVQTLNHRIGQNTVDLINYEIKRDITGDNKRITGKALLLSEIPNLLSALKKLKSKRILKNNGTEKSKLLVFRSNWS